MTNTNNDTTFNYFLKGDISGIQEFIFNVKSEGAAKSLKGRSFFIQALSLICVEKIKQELGKENVHVFYNGGGNFYLELKVLKTEAFNRIKKDIDEICHKYNFYIALAVVENDKNDATQTWEAVNRAVEVAKLSKFQSYAAGYRTYDAPVKRRGDDKDIFDWKALTQFFKQDEPAFGFKKLKTYDFGVDGAGVKLFDLHLTEGDKLFLTEDIITRLPRWNETIKASPVIDKLIQQKKFERTNIGEKEKHITKNDTIIEFSDLADFAKMRTGTAKLGILKMDVDDLGEIFSGLQGQRAEMKKVSNYFSNFFGQKLDELLQQSLPFVADEIGPYRYIDNIYPVFAGGDDCFFVGSWDAIFAWAQLVQHNFNAFAKEIESSLSKLPTISGGIVLLEPTYPVTRFSHLAETALKKAKGFKYHGEREAQKNKICLFDEVLTWEEYGEVLTKATALSNLMQQPFKAEPKSTIEKIRSTAIGYKELHKQARQGTISRPSVSKLFYFVRNSPNQDKIKELIITPFAKELIAVFANQQQCNPLKYPMAARMAEFMTRR